MHWNLIIFHWPLEKKKKIERKRGQGGGEGETENEQKENRVNGFSYQLHSVL